MIKPRSTLRVISFTLGLVLSLVAAAAAPTPKPPGVVIDRSPDFARVYVGCPSIAILPDGRYVASHSWFGPGTNNDTSEVFISADRGLTWTHQATLKGQWWSSLFTHRGDLYIFGVTREYGHIVIRRSRDSGRSWTEPADARTGRLTNEPGYHCAPVPVAVHRGRIWRAFEIAGGSVRAEGSKAAGKNQESAHRTGEMGDLFIQPRPAWPSMVMSAPEEADLLRADLWQTSKPLQHLDSKSQWIEGNVLVTPEGSLINLLRTNPLGKGDRLQRNSTQAAIVHISDDGRTLQHDPARDLVAFPGGGTKFTVRFDPQTKRYWSVPNEQSDPASYRNILVLASSPDLRNWRVESTLLKDSDTRYHAWQYVDWVFDGDDIVAVSRTAWDGSQGAHNANYLTFHRVGKFRARTMADPLLQ